MQSLVEQVTHALHHRRYASAQSLLHHTLSSPAELPVARGQLLELLAQAHEGQHDYGTAAQTWQHAYAEAASVADQRRCFERAVQAYQHTQEYAALCRLAQQQLARARTTQERAACLLTTGEALLHLRRYGEARRTYLEPALRLPDVAPETRAYLWHNLGLSHLAECAFMAAADAFQQSAELVLGLYYAHRAAHAPAPAAQLHHARNTAYFYVGAIHLLYRQAQPALQALQQLQRPMTPLGAFHSALYVALAYCRQQQPEAAERALQTLGRAADFPESLRGPASVVRLLLATLRQASGSIGAHLDAALEAPLGPRTSWEPSWRVLLYQALGSTLQHCGYRQAAIACYEEGVKVAVQRTEHWLDRRYSAWLRGAGLLTALENLPLHTWSATIRGELVGGLQSLAWLYQATPDAPQADTALALALRLATTSEQQVYLWLQRGWLAAVSQPRQDGLESSLARADLLTDLQQARSRCANPLLARMLRGVEALLQQQTALARECFDTIPAIAEDPDVQALCVAAWFWSRAGTGRLTQALQSLSTTPPPWSTEAVLAQGIERLLLWTVNQTAPAPTALGAWLGPLLTYQGAHVLPILHRCCRAGYLPEAQQRALTAALRCFVHGPTTDSRADQAAELLGSEALQQRLEVLLAVLNQSETAAPLAAPALPRRHQSAATRPQEVTRVLHLLRQLGHNGNLTTESHWPESIRAWLERYPRLSMRAPEVVSALLGLLRQCPAAHAVIPGIVERVALSRRQRQGLEAALQTVASGPLMTVSSVLWEPMRHWSPSQLLDHLYRTAPASMRTTEPVEAARVWYALAILLSRVGLLDRAADCLHASLRLAPESPLVGFMLGQIYRLQHRHAAALQHTAQAWSALCAQAPQPQMLHCEVLNQLLVLLRVMQHYDDFPTWVATFERCYAGIDRTALSAAQQQRLQEEGGEFALSYALYLAATSLPQPGTEALAQQLQLLTLAIRQGTPATQNFALHRQAEVFGYLQRYEEAEASYTRILQQWPEDRSARFRLALLTAVRLATAEAADADAAFTQALSLAFAGVSTPPAALTPSTALQWWQQTTPHAPGYTDIADVLTAYASMALQRQQCAVALAFLEPLYAAMAQPQQSYYLAQAYYARSQPRMEAEALQDCERALQYIQPALASDLLRPAASALYAQIQTRYQELTAAQQQTAMLTDYRVRVGQIFRRSGIPCREEEVEQLPDGVWLIVHELVEIDEASGHPAVTMRLCFRRHPGTLPPQPGEHDVALYAQHQHEVQRIITRYGMETFPWPPTVYTGETAFADIFPERLALNRDLMFLAYAESKALWRYAQVLPWLTLHLTYLLIPTPARSVPAMLTAARYLTIVPLLHQRLQGLGMEVAEPPSPEQFAILRKQPVFVDAQAYFQAVVEALRPHLDAPSTHPRRLLNKLETPVRRPQPRRTKPSRTGKWTRHEPLSSLPSRPAEAQ